MKLAEASPPGANGVMFLPHMSGSHCPIVDTQSMGAFTGLRNITTKGDMIRAIIEALDYQFLQMVRGLESGLAVKPEKIVAIGGATNNQFWMQNKADVTGKAIEVPKIEEATTLGAAILAGIGVGLYKNEQQAFEKVYKTGTVFEPNPEMTSRYAELFNIYEQLYPALKDLNVQLRKSTN